MREAVIVRALRTGGGKAPRGTLKDFRPDDMAALHFYRPTPRGLEGKIAEKLAHLRERDQKAKKD